MDATAAREFFRIYQEIIEDLWLEQQCYRNLILEKAVMSEADLQRAVQIAKSDPENRKLAAENFASSRKALAEFALAAVLQSLTSSPPPTDKEN